jgi:hypothetical protein
MLGIPMLSGRSRHGVLAALAIVCAMGATGAVSLAVSAPQAQAYSETFWDGSCSLACPSGGSDRHTWGYVGVTDKSHVSGDSFCEYDWRDYTGTTLSYRCASYPAMGVDSYTDLNPYCSAGYLQRAQVRNTGSITRTFAGYAYTQDYYGNPCN